jgi:hypothetical protein
VNRQRRRNGEGEFRRISPVPDCSGVLNIMSIPVGKAAFSMLCAGIAMSPLVQAATPADAAEVQINLCSAPEAVVEALQLKPLRALDYEVWYVETADMALLRSGVVARLRIKAHTAELTLKFADQDCAEVPSALLPARQSKCEYDMRGARAVGAVSISKALNDDQVRALIADPGGLPALLSPAQVEFLRQRARLWPLPAPLVRLGPVRVQAYRHPGDAFVVEAWSFPSGRFFLELSQKTRLSSAPDLDTKLQDRLTRHKVEMCLDQGSPAQAKLRELLGR